MKYPVELLQKTKLSDDILQIKLKKPDRYLFDPGQYINLWLTKEDHSNLKDIKHTFSISSSPKEDYIRIITRVRESNFKNSLENAPVGKDLYIGDPGGSSFLPRSSLEHIVFVSAGIGITPVLSLFNYINDLELKNRITLFWSIKSVEDAPLMHEIHDIGNTHKNIELNYYFTQDPPEGYKKGRLAKEDLAKFTIENPDSKFHISGTPGFVIDIQSLLASINIPYQDVMVDSFGGY